MVKIIIRLNDIENKIVGYFKVLKGLKTKSQAVKEIIRHRYKIIPLMEENNYRASKKYKEYQKW